MDRELLLEIGCEELPAAWLPDLTRQLADRLGDRLAAFRLQVTGPIESFSTPRRLTARVAKLSDRQTDLEDVLTGPPVSAAFGSDGSPTPAAAGFARKHGVEVAALDRVATAKGEYLGFKKFVRGKATIDVLGDVAAATLRDLAFPKQMNWDARLEDGRGTLPFGRPIRWILFLYGGRVVPFEIVRTEAARSSALVQDVRSAAVTYGHRFLTTSGRAGRAIKVRNYDDYHARLLENFVILRRGERHDKIARELDAHARRLTGRVSSAAAQSGLLQEVPDLVEYPSVVAGTFAPEFTQDLPEEVLMTTMIHHQHFFPVVDDTGKLKPAFLAVTNTQPENERAIARNAERVVTARLRDARFFWDADRRTRLEARVDRLDTILFHKKLGTYQAKAERIERLARWVASEALGAAPVATAASRAARLAKADLVTDMVGEFPELQGTMGGIYARQDGEPEEVWKAIYCHYLPTSVEPNAPPRREELGNAAVTWAAVSLADKLDTVVGMFAAGERPTGSRDPFALRRQAHGALRILLDLTALTGLSVKPALGPLVDAAQQSFGPLDPASTAAMWSFLQERLQYVLEQRGFDVRNVRAMSGASRAVPLQEIRPAQALQMLEVLPEFTESEDFRKLATAFKRVRNIARELDDSEFTRAELAQPALRKALKEPAELALADEIDRRQPVIEGVLSSGVGFRKALAEAAAFGPSVDRFFTEVFVMTEDPALRMARLRLMKRLERLILQLGDISEIVAQPES